MDNGMNHTIATVDAGELRSMFRAVAYAADKRHVREHHRCVYLRVEDQRLVMAATDGFQMGKAWTQVQAGDTESFGLNVDVLAVAIGMLPKTGAVEIARAEDVVTFECESNTSHVKIDSGWSDWRGIKPLGEYQTVPIDLVETMALCRAMKLSSKAYDRTLLKFATWPTIRDEVGEVRLWAQWLDAWVDVAVIAELRAPSVAWSYLMQYRMFAKMAIAAVRRNKHQDHRLSLRAKSLALIETFGEAGHANAVHMIAPWDDRRKS